MYAMDHTVHFEHRAEPRRDRWPARRSRPSRSDAIRVTNNDPSGRDADPILLPYEDYMD